MRFLLSCLLFPCCQMLFSQSNVSFQGALTYPGVELANLWGWVGADGSEYALVGTQQGLSIVDVTVPTTPTQIGFIDGPDSDWREIKTYGNYAYVVTEGTGTPNTGLMIVDMPATIAALRQSPPAAPVFRTYRGNGAINNLLNRAHALQVDETAGFLYLYGSNLFGGRPVVLNLSNPYFPTYTGYYNSNYPGEGNYTHDGYVDNNIMYAGHISGGFFSIVDMTNKTNPVELATQNTPNNFTHNTWKSGNTLFTTDEVSSSFLAAYDISDPEDIKFLDKIQSNPGLGSIVHNTYIINNFAVTSWYKDGITIVDAARPANLVQVGEYDTYPAQTGNGFWGCWGVYPYLPSGNIIASNINESPVVGGGNGTGKLFVLSPTYVRACYLEGTVTDASTNNPLNNATITLGTSPAINEASNSSGQFKTGTRQAGSYTVTVSLSGYQPFSTTVMLNNGVLTILEVKLVPLSLPVELLRFDLRGEGRDAQLSWETAVEQQNKGFEVQQRQGEGPWLPRGFVPAKGSHSNYAFRVQGLPEGQHFFRLEQQDQDGSTQYSDIRGLRVAGGKLRAALLPNLVGNGQMPQLSVFSAEPATIALEIYRTDGARMALSLSFEVEGEQHFPLDLADLPPGSYIALLRTGTGEQLRLPFVRG